ncbi:hypothetical protein B0O99DRAFT_690816 [Bisporella sp. PMI_857]|nr:hypothetical protein B0O99DRAFT_690816 [Bisporella sp. PMI_857]
MRFAILSPILAVCVTLSTAAPIIAEDNSCYYKRDANGVLAGYKRDAAGAEILCGKAKREELLSDLACYYKRSADGSLIGYKRDNAGGEVLCAAW